MQQVVDLQNSSEFQAIGVALVSLSIDPADIQAAEAQALGISVPMLVDADRSVSEAFGVLAYALDNGEPSHTFVLVDRDGRIVWLQDYGAPDNPNRTMYVPVEDLVREIQIHLQ